jgi:hypothetical protein
MVVEFMNNFAHIQFLLARVPLTESCEIKE